MKNPILFVIAAALTLTAAFTPSGAVAAAATLSSTDRKVVQDLAQGNAAEIQLGKLVQKQAYTPAVKDFGKRMVDEHSALQKQVLQFASSHGVDVAAKPDPEQQQSFEKLAKLSGAKFDHEYIQSMLEDHKKDVGKVAQYIYAHPESPLLPVLKNVLPVFENHLRVAENVAGKLGIGPDVGLMEQKMSSQSSAGTAANQ